MKIAYLAPEIPALSATFVYKEILKLKSFGVEVLPFSVHRPFTEASEPELRDLKKEVVHLYERSKKTVLMAHVFLLVTSPLRYLKSMGCLLSDMLLVGLLSRNSLGLVFRFFYAGHLAKTLIKQKCEHLHVHFAHVPTDIAMYASLLSGVTFSVTAHANDLFERGYLLKEKVARSAFFATISEFNKRYLVEKGI
ncbi:MAG: colanic acid biosynthesis glycosyltransferase WcaL, partial [Cycloclasticus sp.]|nr:colanic acid biosynthesis glycosyltransferase WcaL [Cycloclasticus sp.]